MDRHRQIHRQQGDLISLLLFVFFQNKENWLKINFTVKLEYEKYVKLGKSYRLTLFSCVKYGKDSRYSFSAAEHVGSALTATDHSLRTAGAKICKSYACSLVAPQR
jgi:hypothetical protein